MEHPYFIAICRLSDAESSSIHHFAIYYVNNTDEDLEHFAIDSGGFFTSDENPVTLSSTAKQYGTLESRSSQLIEYEGYGLHESIVQYNIYFEIDGEEKKQTFIMGKGLKGGVKPFSKLPVIQKFGYLFKPEKATSYE
ncbi:hypothetical protein [Salisediminibacterium beveridgei]|uniref:Uncharacterized protein n=1 Tax=Salisediminibacterium beveridgei TaxID=632773 RepID=A0A1D7QX16_9BACI|nr:hypothetical protein [Salisediminibacterium beveridgei]AOM83519.1 hypothetical protein BBEV_2161 [Salisediminibacterium beveridgei]